MYPWVKILNMPPTSIPSPFHIFIYTTIIHMQWYIIMYVRLHINYHIYICIYIYIYIYLYDVYFFLPDEYDRTAWNVTSDTCRPDTRSWLSGPGYPLPDTQSRIPDPESQIPYFYVAIPTFTAAFTPASTPPATAVKISICGNCRGRLSVNRSGNRLVTAGLAEI